MTIIRKKSKLQNTEIQFKIEYQYSNKVGNSKKLNQQYFS